MALEAIFTKHNVPYDPSLLAGQYRERSSGPLLTGPNQPAAKAVEKNNNDGRGNLREKRRQMGLCFKCDIALVISATDNCFPRETR